MSFKDNVENFFNFLTNNGSGDINSGNEEIKNPNISRIEKHYYTICCDKGLDENISKKKIKAEKPTTGSAAKENKSKDLDKDDKEDLYLDDQEKQKDNKDNNETKINQILDNGRSR